MADRNWAALALGGGGLVLFAWGLTEVLSMRADRGDSFPAYSTLRSDPMGARALFESLEALPGLDVRRGFQPLDELRPEQTTAFFLGTDFFRFWYIPRESMKKSEEMVARGNRLVIGVMPPREIEFPSRKGGDPEFERWGVRLARDSNTKKKDLYWVITTPGPWRVLAGPPDAPRIVERDFGKGSIVLVTNHYPFSNESLAVARENELISRVVGPNRRIVFDEVHHGIAEEQSVGNLIRRYGLHGLIVALAGLTALFLWRSSSSLLPPVEERLRLDAVSGKDSSAGLVQLLRRSVPPALLIEHCLAEWKRSVRLMPWAPAQRVARAERLALERQADWKRDPAGVYRDIRKLLAERD